MPNEPRQVCIKCGKDKAGTDFYKKKNGQRAEMCKVCTTEHIDNKSPQTFLWILQEFDVPYIEKKWIELYNKIYAKNPAKFGPSSVLGHYLRTMNMNQYIKYHYADSDALNAADRMKERDREAKVAQMAEDQKYFEQLKAQFENGEITEAEYNTKVFDTEHLEKLNFSHSVGYDESELMKQFTDEDRTYLTSKWGPLYKPSEWINMEQMYNDYAQEYELNVDRKETLKQMCKISLKMNQCIDAGDVNAAKNYAAILDSLRKSAKFTEAQNKEERKGAISSIGELVSICEQEGGIIQKYCDPDEYPQDKVDFTLKDMKNYTRNLVMNELGFGDLIESYIKRLEDSEKTKDLDLGLATNVDEELENAVTDEDEFDYQEWIDNELAEEAEKLYNSLNGE